ncbi:MAG TPA: alcohol dehydrogenase catalytic domain-containing protein, partial [Candidatus Limnocylindrales bacterium]|nr:alcohol dehydrogenase catalytic domain-containing protein [Candidatus Limnocylindrales bacterium]
MRALVLERPRPTVEDPLELVDRDDPEPADGELVLRVTACAVCRTDLQIVVGDLPAHRSPIVPGHQAVGEVTAIGPGVEGWAVGDRAGTTWLAGFDGTCRFCRSGRENLCRSASFTGWDRDGGFATAVSVRADVAVRIPVGLDDLAAAPLLCGGVIGYRALRLSGIEPGARLGLYGFGASARQA